MWTAPYILQFLHGVPEKHLCNKKSKEGIDDGIKAYEEETVEKVELVAFQEENSCEIFLRTFPLKKH